MARIAKLTPRFLTRARALGITHGSPLSRTVGAVVAALMGAETLPTLADVEGGIPPTGRAWVRRVPGENLWLWYTFSATHVTIVTLTRAPPVPLS